VILLAALLFQSVQMPLHPSPRPLHPSPRPHGPAPDPATLSIVIADTVAQIDPQPLCAQPNCTSMFLGTFKNPRTIFGPPMAKHFAARLEMGSPFIQPYRLALIVERRIGQQMLILATTGFNPRTGLGCFETKDTDWLGWNPTGPNLSRSGQQICVRE
jgi:hypothetical protein